MGIENLMIGNKNTNPLDILKDLFNPEGITMKTRITPKQFKALIRTKYLEEWEKANEIGSNESGLQIFNNKVVPYGLQLLISINGKSRDEADHILSMIGGSLLNMENEKNNPQKI